MIYLKRALLLISIPLLFLSCESDIFPSDLFDQFVELNIVNGERATFTLTFTEYKDNVLSVTAQPLSGSAEAVTFQCEIDASKLESVSLDRGGEDIDGNNFVYSSDVIAYETGEGNIIDLKIESFDASKKTIKGQFGGTIGLIDDPSSTLEIDYSNFALKYQ